MKRFQSLCTLILGGSATAAEPWICTQVGTKLEYGVAMEDRSSGTTTNEVMSYADGMVTLRIEESEQTRTEHWMVLPAVTQLCMKIPQQIYEMLRSHGLERIRISTHDMKLPASMKPGDRFRGPGFKITGRKDGKRVVVSAVSTPVRVIREERITTPAGTFNAVLVELRSVVSAFREMPKRMHIFRWYTPGIGLLREEITTNTTGLAVTTVQELKKIVKP